MVNAYQSIQEQFASLADPRINRRKLHPLINILTISLLAVLSGADDFTDMEEFGKAKRDWLATFLDLAHGIPSHDTFNRVFARLDPAHFRLCFEAWTKQIAEHVEGDQIAVDGKTVRRSFEKAAGTSAIHMVSAWSSKNRLVLGQVKVATKSNEITAIPHLLTMLDITASTITIDAMGCQVAIAQQIVESGADYVLGLKGNQGSLHRAVKTAFALSGDARWRMGVVGFHETRERGHGRIEVRRYSVLNAATALTGIADWKGLRSIVRVESERTVKEKTSKETRYYISSQAPKAKPLSKAIRSHWGIENSLHWVLDMAFREDESRARRDNAAENLAILRHIALNVYQRESSSKLSMKKKRHKAAWDEHYLLNLLGF